MLYNPTIEILANSASGARRFCNANSWTVYIYNCDLVKHTAPRAVYNMQNRESRIADVLGALTAIPSIPSQSNLLWLSEIEIPR